MYFQQKMEALPVGTDSKYMQQYVQCLIKWYFVYFFNPVSNLFLKELIESASTISAGNSFQSVTILLEKVFIRGNFVACSLYILYL